MGLSPGEARRIAAAAAEGKPLPDGPVLGSFDALALAQAIEHEVARFAGMPHGSKVTLHMDAPDASKLASALRRYALLR